MMLRAAPVSFGAAGSPSATEAVVVEVAPVSVRHAGHLLVADDDPVNLEVLRSQLEPMGYIITVARDGREAVDAMAAHGTFDGVLLDVMMPRMSGPQAAEVIRATHPHGTLPILMLTAKSRPEDAVVGFRAGASDYIGKPFHREELLQRLDTHLQAQRTARAFRRFVPEDFLELLGVAGFEELRAGVGQARELTVLFADVRHFTERSEALGPEETFRFVNECLARFEPVVRGQGGFVDKFIGDAIMAMFPGEPANALRAAELLQREVEGFNAEHPSAVLPLAIGIGVHHGAVILGAVGVDARLELTAIGDAVNVAARLEALTKTLGAGALVSEACIMRSRLAGVRRVGAFRVRGRHEAVELFEVLACCMHQGEREQKQATDDRFQRGLRAYAQGDMARATEHFSVVVREAPLDRVAALYLARSEAFARTGVPDGFEGDVESLTP